MPGGTWSVTELPVLPGLFLNFQAAALAAIQTGARGTVILPVKAHWGPVGSFETITSENDLLNKYAAAEDKDGSTVYNTVRMTLLGGANKILAYRLADTNAKPASLILKDTSTTPADAVKLTAKYPGARGNAFRVTVQANITDNTKQDLKLYEDATLLRTFTFPAGQIADAITTINNDAANVWIVAEKIDDSGTLAAVSSQALTGGNSGIAGITAADYTKAMNAFETQTFNIMSLDGITDPAIQTSVTSWTVRMRNQGKVMITVMGGPAADDVAADAVQKAIARTAGFNHEGIVNVGTGTVLDGVTYSSAQVAPYVAGLIAGQKLSESTTYAASPFDDVTRRWTRTEMEDAVRNGVFIFFHDGRIVKPLRGINSLITLRQGQNNSFKKIRAIRVQDAINSDLQTAAEDNYIGKINNTEEGRLALIAACKQYMEVLTQGGVIEATGWDVYLNPAYYGASATITPEPDQVFMNWTARLTDVIEQIFGTFLVQ
ncbi:phage tail sheath subtilisin-like domain-containing protein [Propionispora vibrioides]|uniref:Phage tail sheath protein n=1 Tax=Propionispora vibrioides TaxID=112903 RepID=A0A1H8U629_9FIRM|nr:phage tail sheath subtilisin-like domain-containing protein [Propionispora vibrioides]SEO98537.1 Phage tail sheath protein [Propionispora vibrioides]